MPPSAFTILWYSLLKIASASFSLATFWRKPNSILARVPSFQIGGSTAPSSRPLKSLYFWITWWIMYMIQVPMGSTRTCAPSLLQEVEHVEVAVAFGGLRPEFAGDLDDRLHAQAVDFDRR